MQIALFNKKFTEAVEALNRVSILLAQIENTSGDMPTRWLDALNGPNGAMSFLADAAQAALVEGMKDMARADAVLVAQFPGGPQSIAAMGAVFTTLDEAGTAFNDAVAAAWTGIPPRVRTSVVSPSNVTTAQFLPPAVIPSAAANAFRADARVTAFRAALTAAGA